MAVDNRFYEHKGPVSLRELADRTGAKLNGNGDIQIKDVAASHSAGNAEICYYEGAKPPGADDINPAAGACFVSEKYAENLPADVASLIAPMPRYAHTIASDALLRFRNWSEAENPQRPTNIHETAVIAAGAIVGSGAAIGDRTIIGPNSVIGPGVQIGSDCEIGANVSVQCALIGNGVKVFSGARIGESGFGVLVGPDGAVDAPQFGRVVIQDGATIGANTCIDRGAFEDTIIGERTKIDNLCQIAHNVVVGRNVMMASFAGISGTVTLGDGVMLGGRVGIADHVTVGDKAQIAASAGVFREIPAGETWGGVPARPIRQWMREIAWLQKQTSPGKKN